VILGFVEKPTKPYLSPDRLDLESATFSPEDCIHETSKESWHDFLALWLILTGLLPLLRISFAGSGTGLDLLALAAGVLTLLDALQGRRWGIFRR
jgi:hypothetical protein